MIFDGMKVTVIILNEDVTEQDIIEICGIL